MEGRKVGVAFSEGEGVEGKGDGDVVEGMGVRRGREGGGWDGYLGERGHG